jgi:hypothetical protein
MIGELFKGCGPWDLTFSVESMKMTFSWEGAGGTGDVK